MKILDTETKLEYEIYPPSSTSTGNILFNCPVCSPDRKKKRVKSLSFNMDKQVGKCHHCEASFVRPSNKALFTEKKNYVRPVWRNKTDLSDKMVQWFKSRGIGQDTLIRARVTEGKAYIPQLGKERNTVQFNYFINNVLINVKYRDGQKNFKMESGAELVFYNLDNALSHKEIIIVEGEMDALSLMECGFDNVISVPNGANAKTNNLTYLDNCIDLFEEGTRFILALDNDINGNNLRDELSRRLGQENCMKAVFRDCKDANECLVKYGKDVVQECIGQSREYPMVGVFSSYDIEDDIDNYYLNGLPQGCGIGDVRFDYLLKFHEGYITTITGIPGHGKSEVVDYICTRLNVLHGWKFAMYSPENHPLQLHFSKIAEKIVGLPFSGYGRMNRNQLETVKDYFSSNFFFINPEENFSLDNILSTVKMLVKKRGVKAFVIDAWNKLEHRFEGNETQYISSELDKLAMFCEKNKVHLFLVAHPAKVPKDKTTGFFDIPTMYSISGSAAFYNKTSNGICVYRNGEKTEVYIQKVKFKHWGQTGMVDYNWNKSNGRFYNPSDQPDNSTWISLTGEQVQQEEQEVKIVSPIVTIQNIGAEDEGYNYLINNEVAPF